MSSPLIPPFDLDIATAKVRMAEDLWNTRDPDKVVLAYTESTTWRNRTEHLSGREEVRAFLARKWESELEYRLIKELWGFRGNRMAVRFCYEAKRPSGEWFRAYGNELWEFEPDGRMQRRIASINDLSIAESERLFHWELGHRPDAHDSLSDLGL